MPTLDLKIGRLERLIGRNLDIKDLEYDLQWISLDLEDVDEEEQTIKVEYNPNRPDFSSPEGIARALKGYYDVELGLPSYEISSGEIVLNVEPESDTSSTTFAFTWDNRDRKIRSPTKGFYNRSSCEIAGGILGGDNYFYKLQVGNRVKK